MPAIDRWVVNHAIESLQPHAALLAGRALGFAINFSGQSLNDEAFADFLLERIAASGLDPELFCFELTENATIANLPRAEALMRRLRRLGCGVALDDFGTGLSSLSYLRQLPVTMLKIDGSFVRDVLKDPRAESMVRAIAQLARSMSITTVAEYVETEEIRDAHRRRSASTTARVSPSAAPSRSRICSPNCRCRARPRTRRWKTTAMSIWLSGRRADASGTCGTVGNQSHLAWAPRRSPAQRF